MKNTKLGAIPGRALSMLLALAMTLPLVVLEAPKAEALRVQPGANMTTTTNIVIWDKIDNMQDIASNADCDNMNAKYSRIMMYHVTGGDRYYFNGHGQDVKNGKEDKLYMDANCRIGNSAHKEWNQDLIDGDHFVTVGGQRTPYIKYSGTKEGYHTWKFFMADKSSDARTNWALCLVDDFEDLYTINGVNSGEWGGKDTRVDGWTIAKTAHVVPQSRWATYDNHVIWHWDNDTGGYDEALEFDLGDRKFRAWNIDTGNCDEFRVYLGAEHAVPTLSEDFSVEADQITTLGRPLFYIPKGKVITVKNEGVLSIDGMLLCDGEIVVKDGGLLILKDGAKIMPLTKYDNDCGKITSEGSIVVGTDSLLCGGAKNGIVIKGGGVVNYGVMAAECFTVGEKYAIENRGNGWVFAGQSPTRAARLRYIMEAVANEGVTRVADPSADFGKIGNVKSSYNIPTDGIYGDAAANVKKSGEEAVGSAYDPTLTVRVKDRPDSQTDETIFKDVKLDRVSLRVSGDTATYTADGQTHTITNKLVSAEIGRGGNGTEVLFDNMWVGSLDGAWVQLEHGSATGHRLALSGGSTNVGTGAIVWTANNDMDKWWHITKAGDVGVDTSYYLESGKSKSEVRVLDASTTSSVSSGSAVTLQSRDGKNDQKWIISPMGDRYYFKNAANQNLCLALKNENPTDGTGVNVQTYSTSYTAQRWIMTNLLTEDAYAETVAKGSALEFIPKSASDRRMAVKTGATSGSAVIARTSDATGANQRWRLEPVGSDNMDGELVLYYRIVSMDTELALTVSGSSILANTIDKYGNKNNSQFWYLEEAPGSDTYYVANRSNNNLVLTAGSSDNAAVTLNTKTGTENQIWKVAGVEALKEEAERKAADPSKDPYYRKTFAMVPTEMSSYRLMGDKTRAGYDSSIGLKTSADANWVGKWEFKLTGKDDKGSYYQIAAADSSTSIVLGIKDGANMADKSQVYLLSSNPENTKQHWRVTENEDGTFTISPRDNDDLALGTYYYTVSASGRYKEDRAPALVLNTNSFTDLSGRRNNTYTRTKWKLDGLANSPLDGKTFTIESAGYADHFLATYGWVHWGSGSYGGAVKGIGKESYARWTFKQIGTEGDKPYFIIYSAHDDKALNWSSGNTYAYTSGDIDYAAKTASYYWFIQTNSDGTYTFIPKSDSKKALNAETKANSDSKTSYTNVNALGSNPTNYQKWKLAEVDPKTDFIDGRVFYVTPKHAGTDMALDLTTNSTANGTQLQLYKKIEEDIERWKFEKLGTDYMDGEPVNYYAIRLVYANYKAMAIPGSTSNGSRPHLWDYSASDKNQQWIVKSAGEGHYYIIPRKDTTKALTCASAGKTNGTAVTLYDNNQANEQKWRLTETMAPTEMGTFELEVVGKAAMSLDLEHDNSDNGTWAILWPSRSDNHARWTFVQMGTNSIGAYYKIVNKSTGKVFDIRDSEGVKEGAYVQQYSYDTGDDQLWYLEKAGSDELGDYYYIKNKKNTSYRLATENAKYDNKTWIVVSNTTGDNAKWRLNEQTEAVSLGIYEFGSANPEWLQMRLDVYGGGTSNGTNVQIWHRTNTGTTDTAQSFEIVQRGKAMYNGVLTPYYSIQNGKSKLTLDPTGAATAANGTNVQQYTYDGYCDQHWFMEVSGDSVIFRNRCDPTLVLASAGQNDNDSNVQLQTYNEKSTTGNQRWYLHPIMLQNGSGQYYIPGNKAAAEAGIPFVQEKDVMLNPTTGMYRIAPAHAAGNTGLRMDLNNQTGPSITAITNNGSAAQRWQLIPNGVDYFDGDGRIFYRIAYGNNANGVVDLEYYNLPSANKSIQFATWDGGYDQLWYLEEVGGNKKNTYYLIGRGTMGKATKICLGVTAGATASNSPIQTATLQYEDYQQWQFTYTD